MDADITILIVEDSPTQAIQLQALLEEQGCTVVAAKNGREALEKLAIVKPTIIISDIVMPEMDGYELCKRLKRQPETRDIPVILVTTLSDPRDVVHGLACGADNFIVKPYDEKYLISRIRYFLVNMELRAHGRVKMGVEVVIEGERHFITADRQQILDLLLSTYEQGIRLNHELKLKHEELSKTSTLMNSLFHFTAGISSAQSEREVIASSLDRIIAIPEVSAAWLLLINPRKEQDTVVLAGSTGSLGASTELTACAQRCPCRHAWLTDNLGDAAINIFGCPALSNHSLQRVHATIPLTLGRETIGILNVLRRHGLPWEQDTLEAMSSIGRQLAIAIGRARLFESLEALVQDRTTALRQEMAERERAEIALRMNEALLRKVLETMPVGIMVADDDGNILLHNPECERIWGGIRHVGIDQYQEYRAWHSDSGDLIRPEEWALSRAVRAGEVSLNEVIDIETFSGERKTILNSAVPILDEDGATQGALALIQDITQQRLRDQDLHLRNRAIESSVNAIVITDNLTTDQPIVYVNPAFERITGYKREEVLGRNCRFLQGHDTEQLELDYIRRALSEDKEGSALLRNYRKDGSLFWNDLKLAPVVNDRGKVSHFIGILNDVTESKRYQDELEHQANHDSLTGLPNRNLLMDRMQQVFHHADRHQARVAIAFIDLDNFKIVNDSLGHNVGDRFLSEIATRLHTGVRDIDTVARLGGDEFIVLIPEIGSLEEVTQCLAKITGKVADPIKIDDHELLLTCSIGFCLYPDDGSDPHVLLSHADTAMYQAKNQGRNRICAFTSAMNEQVQRRLVMERDIRHGLLNNEFLVYYQPQLDLKNGRLCGFEALVRWQHNKRLISPVEFIPLAEETGLITQIDAFVFAEVCRNLRAWQDATSMQLTIAVNLSTLSFHDAGLIERIRNTVRENGIDPTSIKLEVTESVLMGNADDALRQMKELKAMGFQLSIDDFGTGYSSLSYLKRYPFDQLKIDQSFIAGVTTEPESAALTRSMISIGHHLGMKVIAEGVEQNEQLGFLVHSECDEVQGYYYSPPLPAESCLSLLTEDKTFGIPDGIATEAERILLIVYNDSQAQAELRNILSREGYTIMSAADSDEALQLMAIHPILVVLADEELPGVNGVDLLRKTRRLHPDTIRIVLNALPDTGVPEIGAILNAVNEGAVHRFITKPFTPDHIREQIRDAFRQGDLILDNRRLRRSLKSVDG